MQMAALSCLLLSMQTTLSQAPFLADVGIAALCFAAFLTLYSLYQYLWALRTYM